MLKYFDALCHTMGDKVAGIKIVSLFYFVKMKKGRAGRDHIPTKLSQILYVNI
jgi:hypothetical protein